MLRLSPWILLTLLAAALGIGVWAAYAAVGPSLEDLDEEDRQALSAEEVRQAEQIADRPAPSTPQPATVEAAQRLAYDVPAAGLRVEFSGRTTGSFRLLENDPEALQTSLTAELRIDRLGLAGTGVDVGAAVTSLAYRFEDGTTTQEFAVGPGRGANGEDGSTSRVNGRTTSISDLDFFVEDETENPLPASLGVILATGRVEPTDGFGRAATRLEDGTSDQLSQSIGNLVRPEDLLRLYFVALPADAVGEGSSWTATVELALPGFDLPVERVVGLRVTGFERQDGRLLAVVEGGEAEDADPADVEQLAEPGGFGALDVEGRFDVDAGSWRRLVWSIDRAVNEEDLASRTQTTWTFGLLAPTNSRAE